MLRDQVLFITTRQFLDFHFTPAGAAAGVSILAINDPDRCATVEILGAFLAIQVLLEATFDIGRDAGVERSVAGFDDI